MKLFVFYSLVAIFCTIGGIFIAEVSYVFILMLEYFISGEISFSLNEVLRGIKIGSAGGGALGIGIMLAGLFRIKGF